MVRRVRSLPVRYHAREGKGFIAGCPILSGPRVTGDGYYEASLLDPEGNLLELVA
jgi:hypothetical protein